MIVFEDLFRKNTAIMLLIDAANGNIADANETALNFYGYDHKTIVSMNLADINTLPAAELKEQLDAVNKRKVVNTIYKHRTAGNVIKDIQVSTSIILLNGQQYIFAIIQDITEQIYAGQELKLREEKFRKLVTDLTIGIVVHGPDMVINLHNAKALELLGLSANQLLGKTPFSPHWDLSHDDGTGFGGNEIPVVLAKKTGKTVKDIIMGVYRPDTQDRVWLLVTAIPESDADGNVAQVIVTFSDITEIRKKEEDIRRLNLELKELLSYLQTVRTDERNKLATAVHDKIGQGLVGLKFKADFIKDEVNNSSAEFTENVEMMSVEIAAMLKDFLQIYNEANPSIIDDLQLFEIIDFQIDKYNRRGNLEIHFTANIEDENFSYNIKSIISKILDQSLYNIENHTNARNVNIGLLKKGSLLELIMKDDRVSNNNVALTSHEQLSAIEIRELVFSIGGSIINIPAVNNETGWKVTVPLSD